MAICHEYKCCKFANFMNKKKQQQLCKLSWNVVAVGEVGGDVSWHWRLENEGTEASPWTIKEGENAFDRAVWRSQGLGTSGCSWCYRHHFGRLIISCRYQFSASSMRHRSKGRLPQIGEIELFSVIAAKKKLRSLAHTGWWRQSPTIVMFQAGKQTTTETWMTMIMIVTSTDIIKTRNLIESNYAIFRLSGTFNSVPFTELRLDPSHSSSIRRCSRSN